MTELYRLNAADMITRLKSGEVSPTEAAEAAYDRIEQVDGHINAMPTLCRDRALSAAKAIEADTEQKTARKDDPSWLAGLPIAIKDLVDVAGVRTTYGSPIYADHVPERSDIMVERLEANGAVVIGKSNTPEFGAGGNTFNPVFPSTTTPWGAGRSAGGSSGGAASALASGEVWLATGSDYGGSLRTPASFCGIVGLRPSPGRIANGPNPQPFGTMAVEGPMARSVRDTAIFLDAMVGQHPSDPLSLATPEQPFSTAATSGSRPRRAAFSRDLGITPVDPEVADICEKAAEALAAEGWEITDEIPDFSKAMATFHTIRAAAFAAGMGELLKTNRDLLKPDNIWNIENGLQQSGADLAQAERDRGALYHAMAEFHASHDLLLTPTACLPPFPVEWRCPEELGGETFENYMEWLRLPCVLSLTGCPVLSLPVGITHDGLPVGMQFCGPYGGEHPVIAAAWQAEQIFPMADAVPRDPAV
ncbi:MAG: amidase [Rhodospirillales bacterium]|nr:amidase [Rhodospirillales bacterium]